MDGGDTEISKTANIATEWIIQAGGKSTSQLKIYRVQTDERALQNKKGIVFLKGKDRIREWILRLAVIFRSV